MAPLWTPWTDELVEELKRLWAAGYSASDIAKELGDMTRCAVLGKINRLGLERRKPPQQRKPRALTVKRGRPTMRRPVFIAPHPLTTAQGPPQSPQAAQPPSTRAQEEPATPEPKSRKLPLLELEEYHCKWPTHGPPVFLFCGARRRGDGPYCRYHMGKAFAKPRRP